MRGWNTDEKFNLLLAVLELAIEQRDELLKNRGDLEHAEIYNGELLIEARGQKDGE